MSIEILFLVIYFVAMAGIGFWAMKRGKQDAEGFLLGGRSLGPGVTALRLQSSSMSGYMFMGAGSLGYTQGYFGMWYALGDLGGGNKPKAVVLDLENPCATAFEKTSYLARRAAKVAAATSVTARSQSPIRPRTFCPSARRASACSDRVASTAVRSSVFRLTLPTP